MRLLKIHKVDCLLKQRVNLVSCLVYVHRPREDHTVRRRVCGPLHHILFTREVNSTSEPRETSSYVSLLSTRPNGFVIVYERRGPPDTVFAMRVSLGQKHRSKTLQ